MSYTAMVKEALLALPVKSPCCRKALLHGILYMRGKRDASGILLPLPGDHLATVVTDLMQKQYNRLPEMEKAPGKGMRILRFSSHSAEEYLENSLRKPFYTLQEKSCDSCYGMILRGLFLAGGRVSDPEKGYCLEFSCGERRDGIDAFLTTLGYPPKRADRRQEKLLYYKDNAAVSDLLSLAGVPGAAYAFINTMIEKEYRTAAVRRANCETGNIAKAVMASIRQIEEIEALFTADKAGFLPPELYETAKLRLEHRDLSLSQLAAITRPPLTKSGLFHRLCKICELSREILEKPQTPVDFSPSEKAGEPQKEKEK